MTFNIVFSLTTFVYRHRDPALTIYQLNFALVFLAMWYFTNIFKESVIRNELKLLH